MDEQSLEELQQEMQDLQDLVQSQQDEIDNHESRILDIESPGTIGIDSNLQFDIEDTIFNVLNVLRLVAGLPIYTSLRDLVNNPPKQGEIWLEDISGTRKIAVMISGTAYKVTVA